MVGSIYLRQMIREKTVCVVPPTPPGPAPALVSWPELPDEPKSFVPATAMSSSNDCHKNEPKSSVSPTNSADVGKSIRLYSSRQSNKYDQLSQGHAAQEREAITLKQIIQAHRAKHASTHVSTEHDERV